MACNIDSILPNHEHTAIQQPPYNHEVSQTKLAWLESKRRLKGMQCDNTCDITQVSLEA
jgi:hypothetical protein